MILACALKGGGMVYLEVPSYQYNGLLAVMASAVIVGKAVDVAPHLAPKDGFKVLDNEIAVRMSVVDIVEEINVKQLQGMFEEDAAARAALGDAIAAEAASKLN